MSFRLLVQFLTTGDTLLATRLLQPYDYGLITSVVQPSFCQSLG